MPAKAKAKQAKVQAKKDENKATNVSGRNASKSVPAKSVPAKSVPAKPAPAPTKSPAKGKVAAKAPAPIKVPATAVKVDPKRSAPVADSSAPTSGIKKTKTQEKIVKAISKGGAVVDSLVPGGSGYRVFQDGGKIYSATLNQSNLLDNNNKFYIIQILQHEANSNLYVWNRWGRVGVPGQNALKGPMPKDACIREFNNKYHDKTVKGDYREIQIKYEDEEEEKKPQKKTASGPKKEVKSKMDDSMQRLMSLIFDVNILNNTMKEIGYDAKKMPLGRLGDSTIKQAYAVLNKLTDSVKKKNRQQCMTLSGEFYSLIPHDFGFQKMANFVLDNEEKVKDKLKMLETISDMKITSKLIDEKKDDNESVHDQNYKKLGCSIEPVSKSGADYKLLTEYFNNTKGGFGKVKISDVFEVVRPAEQKMYNTKIGNNMLLWHGSRVSNFVGILSQGMRIAPPEAPASGYNFGKGIYLADMAEKSINYCRSYGQPTALILLMESAIGQPNVLTSCNFQAKELMVKAKKDSTKCHGARAPPESCYTKMKNIVVPNGKPTETKSGSYMGHNEYIVYNINQARIKYILRMEMNGN